MVTQLVGHAAGVPWCHSCVLSVQGGRGRVSQSQAALPGPNLLQCQREKGYSIIQALGLSHRSTIPFQSPALPACWLAEHPKIQHRVQPPLLCWLSVADCKAPPELEHGFVTFSTRNNLTTYQAAIQYHCQHPYYHMAPNSTGEQWGQATSPRHSEAGHMGCKWGEPGMAAPGCSANSRLWM